MRPALKGAAKSGDRAFQKLHAFSEALRTPKASSWLEENRRIAHKHRRRSRDVADKGYDAGYIMEEISTMDAHVVIPSKSNRKALREYDSYLYKEP